MARLTNIPLIEKMISEGYITVQKHPSEDIYIYKYSKVCAIAHMWNEATLQCRGVITDKDYNVLSRPFSKFFNLEEIEDASIIPTGEATAYEKIDGSLGITYWIDDVPYLATMGSFTSEQAIHGTKILHSEKYRKLWDFMRTNRGFTFLFEIVYPENRVVVNYGETDDIFLLAIINNAHPENEIPIELYSKYFQTPKCYGTFKNWINLREEFDGTGREGFVLKFENGFRLKLKYKDYFQNHFLRTYLTKKSIFDFFEDGRLDELYNLTNDFEEEDKIMVKSYIEGFEKRLEEIESEAKSEYREFETDKEAAEYFKTCKWRAILFAMRKGKPYRELMMKVLRDEIKKETNAIS